MIARMLEGFKSKLEEGPVFGPFSRSCDPGIVETIGYAGFDFIILDMEHGPNSVETVQSLVRAAQVGGVLPIVRVPDSDPETISKVLDVGAAGIQIPQVRCKDDACKVVEGAKFFPDGMRGLCRYVRAAGYSSVETPEYIQRANKHLIVLQLEGQDAFDHLDEILAVEGIDIIFIGPYDLSQSLGLPGQTEHPIVISKIQQIVDACLARDIVVGTFTETPEQAHKWIDQGLKYICFSVDMGIIYQANKELVLKLHKGQQLN